MVSKLAKSKPATAEANTIHAKAVSSSDSVLSGGEMPVVSVRRKEMVARIATSSGVKPNLIKSVLDAVLKEMGDALSAGETLNLPPLGKIRVNRSKDVDNAEILICKIRRNKPAVVADAISEAVE